MSPNTPLKRRPLSTNVTQLQQVLENSSEFIQEAGARLPLEEAGRDNFTGKAAGQGAKDKTPQASPNEHPWVGVDDGSAHPIQYSVKFPASLYAKMKFISANMPGGKSVQKIAVEATEQYVTAKLSELGID